jgi:hypothetical protein
VASFFLSLSAYAGATSFSLFEQAITEVMVAKLNVSLWLSCV